MCVYISVVCVCVYFSDVCVCIFLWCVCVYFSDVCVCIFLWCVCVQNELGREVEVREQSITNLRVTKHLLHFTDPLSLTRQYCIVCAGVARLPVAR